MEKDFKKEVNICLMYGCSECCNPVKIDIRRTISIEKNQLPFVKMEGLLVPKSHPDSIRLKSYQCFNYNTETGLCMDYLNRPEICKNTTCRAFKTLIEGERKEIVEKIKSERFFEIS